MVTVQVSDLPYLPATQALALLRARELSPVELMEAVIARAEAAEPVINAFAETLYEDALAQARAAAKRYAGAGEPPRALEGLPVAVKEEAPIAGQRNTLGSLPLRDQVASDTAVFAQRIIDAGGSRACTHDHPGILLRPVHLVQAVGGHP